MKEGAQQLEELMSALSHKIRTPLSIIQNELSCIRTKISEEEYQAILSACKQINSILKEPLTSFDPGREGANE